MDILITTLYYMRKAAIWTWVFIMGTLLLVGLAINLKFWLIPILLITFVIYKSKKLQKDLSELVGLLFIAGIIISVIIFIVAMFYYGVSFLLSLPFWAILVIILLLNK